MNSVIFAVLKNRSAIGSQPWATEREILSETFTTQTARRLQTTAPKSSLRKACLESLN
jgi:hypothetical protein